MFSCLFYEWDADFFNKDWGEGGGGFLVLLKVASMKRLDKETFNCNWTWICVVGTQADFYSFTGLSRCKSKS